MDEGPKFGGTMTEGWLLLNGCVAASLEEAESRLIRFHGEGAVAALRLTKWSIVVGRAAQLVTADQEIRAIFRSGGVRVASKGALIVTREIADGVKVGDVVEVRVEP